jgi:putative spermidine/putrescine transport system permease protein
MSSGRKHSAALQRAFAAPAAAVIVLMLLPVAVVVGISIGQSATYQFPPTGLTLRWFASFFSSEAFTAALFWISLPLGLAVSVFATIIGTLAAIGIVRVHFPGKRYLELLFVVPVIFPQILLGVGLFLLYARLGVSPALWSLALGHLVIATPYVIRTVVAGLTGIDMRVEEAAQNLGAHPIQAFYKVTLPLLRSSIISGAIFAFIISFSDINIALFLSAANTTTLPIQILAQMQLASDPTIAAASTVQVLIISLLLLVIQRIVGTVRL